MGKYIATIYRQWMRWQYDLNRRLRRGGLIGVLLILSIGVFGPLACIFHCTVLDALYPSAAMHAHHHLVSGSANEHLNHVAVQTLVGANDTAVHSPCHLAGDGSPVETPLAQALYELAPAAALLLPMLVSSAGIPLVSALTAVWKPRRPPLRPPRLA